MANARVQICLIDDVPFYYDESHRLQMEQRQIPEIFHRQEESKENKQLMMSSHINTPFRTDYSCNTANKKLQGQVARRIPD